MIAGMGTPEKGHIRFGRSQAGLLDALLASEPEASCDETFTLMRRELRNFTGVQAVEQPAGFQGQLRDYQREGLGWMEFLRRFSFGGCLADDMGVGKTAQVLALLEKRREARAGGERVPPSLVVVPRSLIFNWKEEAERFTPQLRVLDYTGLERNRKAFPHHDVILTTYGTLRRDIPRLKDFRFDYLVLDEAQAVKNSSSEGAKAVRLLRGDHRLALSGTPVENHLGELWSLFEFLNPGMLGAASVLKLTAAAGRNPDEETRQLLAQALRPFILRRTKEQVARELPARSEQTVYCELKPEQRKLYNELRDHYRQALLGRIATEGLAKSKIMVLEALLRLRQAACHPALIEPKRAAEPSAKLETLIEQLAEVLDGGHKALVFSQFTKLLALVRQCLDEREITYEYLDGRTRDRQARVKRFQIDPECRLFLISLKAGGLGLNLTAADYVFLLDPWWNPAVEAQAVDRAHRIGQTRHVFAYRLIARDTVEEKVLELQKTKRDLATAIIGADNSLIRDLKREDLELLLS
jgi:SNF2 family DNA or RNA helicase